MIIVTLFLPIAVFGITYIMRYTDGPFDIFRKLRILLGFKYIMDNGNELEIPDDTKFLCKLYSCVPCLSTWIGMFVGALVSIVYNYNIVEWFVISFAAMGFTIIVHCKVVNNG